ncbi:MAG TPA: 2OG-Fe(II) oxygenase [Thermoanaerobaculia bacterium]|nr:2OG-Fe(II) oxygenase [Thermoanaerobaculia bacterium]
MNPPLILEDFLDDATRASILRALENAPAAAAPVYGSAGLGAAVQPRARSTRMLAVDDELRTFIHTRLGDLRPQLERHFSVALQRCEDPQFLRYDPGDFFVAHQDGNTSLIHDDSRHRRISVIALLNSQYGGGSLVFHGSYPDWDARYTVPPVPGALIAFPSETTHEVTPVTHGVRYSIVSWYR